MTTQQPKSRGQLDYEADVTKDPNYQDGAPRKSWSELCKEARWSWERQPTEPTANQ